jgi:hypothetical protein
MNIGFYDSLAKKIGYVNFEQMLRNEDEIDEQTIILFNYICRIEEEPIRLKTSTKTNCTHCKKELQGFGSCADGRCYES